ncbi:hypothetical protein [Legionella pneumophila]|uniref:hypothetical protein n=1 Tax=Legionella pneumophila TaxID=446 RepID=UPI0004899AA1|nr:hypothetical protein [Legionella pneumophila]STX65073.1 insertion element IS2 transposase InsD [Legionella pneumophila]HAT2149909.1 hypothetical protein [Legionella pneumophila]HAT2152842.1 hypothetical protein [Legionella pneumophila]HAT8703024.1 hypothetical protein [Legionella pneumophila]HAT8731185.1 hypothetical protein [Legionella pneumophila]
MVHCCIVRDTASLKLHLGFDVRTTPTYSPESKGIVEAFLKTFKRDYVVFFDPEDSCSAMKNPPE